MHEQLVVLELVGRVTARYIVIRETSVLSSTAYLHEVIDADVPTFKRVAMGKATDIERLAKALNDMDSQTELVAPEDINVGDVVVVKLTVSKRGTDLRHLHATRGTQSGPWQMGDQYLWTWGWTGANEMKIERIKK